MLKKSLLMLLFGLGLTVISVPELTGQTNIALDAAGISTSYVSSWEILEAVNDGYQPANSGDKGPGAYGNWQGTNNYDRWDWVEYSFTGNSQIDSVAVYWWTDNGGIQIPYEAHVEYWGCGEYINAGDIGVQADKFNTLAIDAETYKVRISMRSVAATGILEFQVFGSAGVPSGLIPYIQVNSQAAEQISEIEISLGDTVRLSNGLLNVDGGLWSWTGPKGFSSTDSTITIEDIKFEQTGLYKARLISDCGIIYEQNIFVFASVADGEMYQWPSYTPTLDYDFREEYPGLEMPTKNSQDCNPSIIAGEISSGWWTFIWGHNKRSVVTEAAINPMLEKFNTDFAYIRDTMGWPPDKRAKEGFRSAIYLYGSGLCTDNADSNALGGWQGSVNGYPMVLASYYPVYSFDPDCPYSDRTYQTEGMIHEGIHSILADMPGGKDACWFQEGGNTWLQQEMASRRSGNNSSMGSLNGCTFLAPFMPIECYSGWLQDGSFGGPCAQGVNMYEGSKQICTWRNYLGGTQYGNGFPTLLAQMLGEGSIPWIWRYCPGTVLEGMADTLGDTQMRRLITEYRAKQALIDMQEWTGAVRKLLDANMNLKIGSEWQPAWLAPDLWIASPYTRTLLEDDGTLVPEYRTTPGWSGANQIPLKVKADSVQVKFEPMGENMKCLLAYRDAAGNCIYSAPVDSGNCSMLLQRPAANDVVIAVIVNTEYEYKGEETRKAHFDYRLVIDTNLVVPAHTHKRWYAWDDDPDSDVPPELPAISLPDTFPPTDLYLALKPVYESDNINTEIGVLSTKDSANIGTHTYVLVAGDGDDDNPGFKINKDKLLIKTALDYETKPLCFIRVRTTDLLGKSYEKSFEIPVLDAEELNLEEHADMENAISIFPNPFSQSTSVKMLNGELISSIEIINQAGASMQYINNIDTGEYIIEKGTLQAGIYYLKIKCTVSYMSKIVIQ